MEACIVENNIITNVVMLPAGADPAAFGCKPLPPGKWIGDEYDSDASLRAQVKDLSEALELLLSGATEETEASDEA